MADDPYARIAQLEAEVAALRQAHTAELAGVTAERDVALEQQTATADILRGIALSPTEAQPVLDTIVHTAGRLSNSTDSWLSVTECDLLHVVAGYGVFDHPVYVGKRLTMNPAGVNQRTLDTRRTLHVPDSSAPAFRVEFPGEGHPDGIAFLNVPLVRKDVAIGLLTVARDHAKPYTAREIALLDSTSAILNAGTVLLGRPVRGRFSARKGSETVAVHEAVHDRQDVYDRHDVHDRHDVWRVERMLLTAAALIFAVSFMFLVIWLAMSEQKTKLYEADNIVCASQPLAINCWERKPR
jgi:hypothetical protein